MIIIITIITIMIGIMIRTIVIIRMILVIVILSLRASRRPGPRVHRSLLKGF